MTCEKPGVRDRAVVALEVVLDTDLPVRRVLGVDAVVEAERLDVDAAGAELRRHLADVVGEGRIRCRVDEDERPPRLDRDRHEPKPLEREPRLALRPRCGAQRPAQVVRPRVVGTLQALTPAFAVDHDRAPVPADVDERAQRPLAVAHDDHRQPAGAGGDVRPRLRDLVSPRRVLPEAPEDALLLAAQDVAVDVPAPGQRAREHG
jgi:hypothetical protein